MKHTSHPFGTLTRALAIALVSVCLVSAASAWAQLPTGTLMGHVSSDGLPMPGVSVTAKSPALQGSRTVVTSGNGDYAIINLPPGEYTVTFMISGFREQTLKQSVGASQTVTLNSAMSISEVTAQTVVMGRAEQISEQAQASTTYTTELLGKLPTARTIASAVNLTPGVNANGPNGAFTVSGAQSFDNNFTVNGVNIQDNVRGTPFNLFIEDAIQETTTSTSAISAEFGRFQGGVINTITKSGGNAFSGSLRVTANNDAWVANTPKDAGTARVQDIFPTYEATLGGPMWKDKIWFFGAVRIPKTSNNSLTLSTGTATENFDNPGSTKPVAGPAYVFSALEKRYEGKLTLSPFQNHTLTGGYIWIDQNQANNRFTPLPQYDLASLETRQLPQKLLTANYSGVITDKFFVEGQYSKRQFTFENSGSQFNDLIQGTVLHDRTGGGYYNSPIFCAVCPGSAEKRDNEDILAKGTYFLSTPGLGSHNIVVGFDDFAGSRLSNNWQSGSSYFINGTRAIFKGGDIFPVVDANSYMGFYPIANAANPTDTRTISVFLNDQWKLNNNLSFNLGVRWDKNHAKDSKGAITADDSDFSPRLAATFDPTGNGKIRFNASYARYVGAIQDTQAGAASGFGAPAAYYYAYYGPEINTDPNAALLTRAQAIQAVFNWFGITAPNQFPTQHASDIFGSAVPGLNTVILGSLKSPSTDEFAVGVAGNLSSRGSFRVDGVYRKAGRFYSNDTTIPNGIATDAQGNLYDIGVVNNLDDPLSRKYYGLSAQVAYRPLTSLNIGANWTWSHTYGNFLGETAGSGPVQSAIQSYPEYKQLSWNSPTGDLLQDQRHKVRLYATYDLPTPKALGIFTFSVLQSYDSGTPYGAVGQVRSQLFVTNPGYVQPPSGPGSPTYYFSARDAFHTDNINRTDIALNYSKNIGPVEVFFRPDVLNLFNRQGLVIVNTTVLNAVNSGNFANFNPFTTTPVECPQGTAGATCKASGANWQKGASFGQATSPAGYQLARTVRATLGVRF
jgi:outer membrane receptor for ferrienterochelin and colicin